MVTADTGQPGSAPRAASPPLGRPPIHPLRALARRAVDRAPWLIDLYRAAAHPRWEAAVWRDFRATRRSLGWLRALPDPGPEADRVLAVIWREDVFNVKVGLMQGAALKLAGVHPVVLANHRRVPRIRRYARAFGVGDLRYRSQVDLDPEAVTRAHARADELMTRHDDFATARDWTFHGHPLGERVLSTLIRQTLDGAPDLADPAHRRRLDRLLRLTLRHYLEAEALLDQVQPRWVLAEETGYATNGPLVDVALSRGMDVIETSPYLRDGSLVFKRMNGSVGRKVSTSVAPETLERLEHRPWTDAEDRALQAELENRYGGSTALQRMYQWNTRDLDRETLCRHLDLDPERPLVVVFSHVLWDASFFYGEDLFENYGEWLAATVGAAVANPRAQWLIKTHPANAFRLSHGDVRGPVAEVEVVRRRWQDLPDHVRLLLPDTPVSSLALYRHADVGVTVRGTAGLEMACFGKPVVTGGSGHYSGLGFTLDSATPEEYLARLDRIEEWVGAEDANSRRRARRYTHALLLLRPWIGESFRVVLDYPEEGRHPLDRNLVAAACSLAEAEAAGDLHAWAAWAAESRDADFVNEAARAQPADPNAAVEVGTMLRETAP